MSFNHDYSPQYVPSAPLVRPTSGAAVAGFVLSLLWFFGLGSVLAIFLCGSAMHETSRGLKGGHGLAVTGMILGILGAIPVVIFLLILIVGALGGAGS